MGYASKIIAFFKKCWSVIKKIWQAVVKFADIVHQLEGICRTIGNATNAIAVAVKDGNNILETVIQEGEMRTETSQIVEAGEVASDVEQEYVITK